MQRAGDELCSPCYRHSRVSLSWCRCSPGRCARATAGTWPRQTPACPAFLRPAGPSHISAAAEGIRLHTRGSGPAVLFFWKLARVSLEVAHGWVMLMNGSVPSRIYNEISAVDGDLGKNKEALTQTSNLGLIKMIKLYWKKWLITQIWLIDFVAWL